MSGDRIPFTLTIQPWFQDHCVSGKIVLPAVETMIFLAGKCLAFHPSADIRVMEDVAFGKFLEIPRNVGSLAVLLDCTVNTEGRIQTKLLSHMRLATMSRIKEHGEIFFPPMQEEYKEQCPTVDPSPLTGIVKEINSECIYRDLVPFGRFYHTLEDTLYLSEHQAWGKLRAPEIPFAEAVQDVIGSPFPLDGAMHAACVLGQQLVAFAPFPTGFKRRVIYRPTQPGGCYFTRVSMIARTGDELVFNLHIFNSSGQLYETVTGIRMRDVRKAIKQ